MNGLAVAAFTGVAFVVVVSALSFAFSNFLLGDMMFAQFGEVGYQIVFWGKLVLPVVLYTVGLVMGIVATRPGRSNRGKMLGYVAIGGAACGLVTKVLVLAGSSLVTLFY